MTKEGIFKRPKWLKIIIGIFSAWLTFMLSMIVLFIIILVIEKLVYEAEIEGTLAVILIIVFFIISVYVAFRITKWQNKYLDKKSLIINYVILVFMIILSGLLLPVPMTYMIL